MYHQAGRKRGEAYAERKVAMKSIRMALERVKIMHKAGSIILDGQPGRLCSTVCVHIVESRARYAHMELIYKIIDAEKELGCPVGAIWQEFFIIRFKFCMKDFRMQCDYFHIIFHCSSLSRPPPLSPPFHTFTEP